MNKLSLYCLLIFIFFADNSFSQGILISQPRLKVDGNNLFIYYDLLAKNSTDRFFVWVELRRANGEKINVNSLSGDVGSEIKSGINKRIIWAADMDSVFLNEDINVEVNAEKYIKSFSRGSVLLKSAILPGWGQTTISKGKPWWIAGLAVYGTLTGGYLYHRKYLDSYELYKMEADPSKRSDLYDQSQKQSTISSIMICSAATAWAANILWVALIPNSYSTLHHVSLSINSSSGLLYEGLLFSFNLNF